MTKTVVVAASMMLVSLLVCCAKGGVSVVMNGSFENDGQIIFPITVEDTPAGWTDVNFPEYFGGWVGQDWTPDGVYNLSLSLAPEQFNIGETGTLSQYVNLADVNEIIFDLKLVTSAGSWDPNVCTAVLLIDDDPNALWDSERYPPDSNAEYDDETVDVSGKYDDRGWHKLSLGMRVEVEEVTVYYAEHWDDIRFDIHCGGFGFLPADFSRDCYVDVNDLQMLEWVWLDIVDPNSKYNLSNTDEVPYGIINFLDFADYADHWDGNMPDLKMFTEVWLAVVDANNEYNLYQSDDIPPDAVINSFDFAAFAEYWLRNSYE